MTEAQSEFVKICPKPDCQSERPVTEIYCQNIINGKPCGWNLVPAPVVKAGTAPSTAPEPAAPTQAPTCPNGHPAAEGDFLCSVCGEPLSTDGQTAGPGFSEVPQAPFVSGPDEAVNATAPSSLTDETETAPLPDIEIDGWLVVEQIGAPGQVRERFSAVHSESGDIAVLTLYSQGAEPDPEVYEVLQRTDHDHIPELIAFGHWQGRPFEISERITGGRLSDLELPTDNKDRLRTIVDEIGRALESFAQMGLRHRDLRPDAILVRDRATLDLVITGFGSARLSEFDLDLVSPLETTRYTAPEAVLGGVAAASDWWSLGMILLEKLTDGACFSGINEQAFLIHVLTHGVTLPEDLDSDIQLLLRGLLARERTERWQWAEVKAWLDGEPIEAPVEIGPQGEERGPAIKLGGREYRRLSSYALAAADAANWDEARDQFLHGRLIGWAKDAELDKKRLSLLRSLAKRELEDDFRLGIALKALNPDMPFIQRGDIVTPGWLTQNAQAGYALITSDAPGILAQMDAESWLGGLKKRVEAVRARAAHHDIELNEPELRVYLLATSRANLSAMWDERRKLLPDTDCEPA